MDVEIDLGAIHFGLQNAGFLLEDLYALNASLSKAQISDPELKSASLLRSDLSKMKNMISSASDVRNKLQNSKNMLINMDREASLFFQYVDTGVLDENLNFTDVPYLDQTEFGDVGYMGGTIYSGGCGITSMAMALSYINNDILTPKELASLVTNHYNYESKMVGAADALGIENSKESYIDNNELRQYLAEGKLAIVLVKDNSHFVLCKGVTDDGRILVNDPYGPWQKDHPYTDYDLQRSSSRVWIVDPYENVGNAKTNIGVVHVDNSVVSAINAANESGQTVEITDSRYWKNVSRTTAAQQGGNYTSTIGPTTLSLQGTNTADVVSLRATGATIAPDSRSGLTTLEHRSTGSPTNPGNTGNPPLVQLSAQQYAGTGAVAGTTYPSRESVLESPDGEELISLGPRNDDSVTSPALTPLTSRNDEPQQSTVLDPITTGAGGSQGGSSYPNSDQLNTAPSNTGLGSGGSPANNLPSTPTSGGHVVNLPYREDIGTNNGATNDIITASNNYIQEANNQGLSSLNYHGDSSPKDNGVLTTDDLTNMVSQGYREARNITNYRPNQQTGFGAALSGRADRINSRMATIGPDTIIDSDGRTNSNIVTDDSIMISDDVLKNTRDTMLGTSGITLDDSSSISTDVHSNFGFGNSSSYEPDRLPNTLRTLGDSPQSGSNKSPFKDVLAGLGVAIGAGLGGFMANKKDKKDKEETGT